MTTQTTTPQLTEKEAIDLANEIIRLEATTKAMKDKLKTYIRDNGELVAGDNVWSFQNAIKWEFNDSDKTKSFIKSLAIDGYTLDPFSLVSFSKTKLEKLGLEDNYIEQFATKKTMERFGKRKLK